MVAFGENAPNDPYQWLAWSDPAFRNILPAGRGLAPSRRWTSARYCQECFTRSRWTAEGQMAKEFPSGREAERLLSTFIDRFDDEVAVLIRTARKALRKKMPSAIEQIYDNYNFLAIGFCTTERTSDCVVSLAASAKGVALSFYRGADLPDPKRMLLGSGVQNRFLRIEDGKTLQRDDVGALIDAALSNARTPMASSGKGTTLIKSVSAKQRPRRTTLS
jgi:hypothetical protein